MDRNLLEPQGGGAPAAQPATQPGLDRNTNLGSAAGQADQLRRQHQGGGATASRVPETNLDIQLGNLQRAITSNNRDAATAILRSLDLRGETLQKVQDAMSRALANPDTSKRTISATMEAYQTALTRSGYQGDTYFQAVNTVRLGAMNAHLQSAYNPSGRFDHGLLHDQARIRAKDMGEALGFSHDAIRQLSGNFAKSVAEGGAYQGMSIEQRAAIVSQMSKDFAAKHFDLPRGRAAVGDGLFREAQQEIVKARDAERETREQAAQAAATAATQRAQQIQAAVNTALGTGTPAERAAALAQVAQQHKLTPAQTRAYADQYVAQTAGQNQSITEPAQRAAANEALYQQARAFDQKFGNSQNPAVRQFYTAEFRRVLADPSMNGAQSVQRMNEIFGALGYDPRGDWQAKRNFIGEQMRAVQGEMLKNLQPGQAAALLEKHNAIVMGFRNTGLTGIKDGLSENYDARKALEARVEQERQQAVANAAKQRAEQIQTAVNTALGTGTPAERAAALAQVAQQHNLTPAQTRAYADQYVAETAKKNQAISDPAQRAAANAALHEQAKALDEKFGRSQSPAVREFYGAQLRTQHGNDIGKIMLDPNADPVIKATAIAAIARERGYSESTLKAIMNGINEQFRAENRDLSKLPKGQLENQIATQQELDRLFRNGWGDNNGFQGQLRDALGAVQAREAQTAAEARAREAAERQRVEREQFNAAVAELRRTHGNDLGKIMTDPNADPRLKVAAISAIAQERKYSESELKAILNGALKAWRAEHRDLSKLSKGELQNIIATADALDGMFGGWGDNNGLKSDATRALGRK